MLYNIKGCYSLQIYNQMADLRVIFKLKNINLPMIHNRGLAGPEVPEADLLLKSLQMWN